MPLDVIRYVAALPADFCAQERTVIRNDSHQSDDKTIPSFGFGALILLF